MGVKEQAVHDIAYDHIENGIAGQNGSCHRDAKEADVGVYSHQIIKAMFLFLSTEEVRQYESHDDHDQVEGNSQCTCREKVAMGGGQIARQDRGHDQGRIADIDHDGGKLFGGQPVNNSLLVKIDTNGNQNADDSHLL